MRFREMDDLYYLVMATGALSTFSLQGGDREGAGRWFLETLMVGRELGDDPAMTVALPLMAAVVFELAGPVPAATIMGAYEGLSKRYGVKMPRVIVETAGRIGPPERASGALDADTYQQAFERGRSMDADEIVTYIIETMAHARPSRGAP